MSRRSFKTTLLTAAAVGALALAATFANAGQTSPCVPTIAADTDFIHIDQIAAEKDYGFITSQKLDIGIQRIAGSVDMATFIFDQKYLDKLDAKVAFNTGDNIRDLKSLTKWTGKWSFAGIIDGTGVIPLWANDWPLEFNTA